MRGDVPKVSFCQNIVNNCSGLTPQTELLIDVTSHELRQPVSAILNCSHLVRANLASLRDQLYQEHLSGQDFRPSRSLIETIDEDIGSLDAIYQVGVACSEIYRRCISDRFLFFAQCGLAQGLSEL